MILAAISLEEFKNPLVWFGFAGQGVFMMRFIVQWLISERRGRSHVPVAFWWLSLLGGMMLLTYAFLRGDPVISFAQLLGLPIYARNLMLIHGRYARIARRRAESNGTTAAATAATAGAGG
ncbi:MAG: lipid-A-disaccharide synthase N-terminal domain-containing protein [Phycisphaerae bacterium]|nr:lipid-A-disaccharide synthase N-terminal domain-containing protein [Phycisphaerae bacterium]